MSQEELRRRVAMLEEENARLRAEAQARRSLEEGAGYTREQVQAVLESLTEALVIVDTHGDVVYHNPASLALHGYATWSEAHGPLPARHGVWELSPVEGTPLSLEDWPLARALRGERFTGLEVRARRRDTGHHFIGSYSGTPVYGAGGRLLYAVVTIRDVTERWRDQQRDRLLARAGLALASSLEYEATLQHVACLAVPDVADWCLVHLLDQDGHLMRVAGTHADPDGNAVLDEMRRRFPEGPTARAPMLEVLRTGHSMRRDFPDGAPPGLGELEEEEEEQARLVGRLGLGSAVIAPLAARGCPLGTLTLVYGHSGRRYTAEEQAWAEEVGRRAALAVENARLYAQAEAARAAAQEASQAKDQFLALVSHELRNPLNTLLAGLEVAKRSLPEGNARLHHTFEILDRSAKLQARLVNDLLDLSRITRGVMHLQQAPVDLSRLLCSVTQGHQREADQAQVNLTTDVEPGLWVMGDPDRLAQVAGNLASNALRFTPAGGDVRVSACATEGPRIRIVVADTGIGIDRDLLGRLWEMFLQGETAGRRQGLGLGLALVKALAELQGGRVWVESEGLGRGSRFTVELPGLPAPHAVPAEEPPAARGQAVLLLVEDNDDTRTLVAHALELSGYTVRAAGSGEEALALLAEAPAPRLLLSDIGLPGMDGYEFLRRARALPAMAHVPAFALTGWGRPDDVARARQAGYVGHFTKPIDVPALERRIGEILG